MVAISRVHTFLGIQPPTNFDLNAELDQLVNSINLLVDMASAQTITGIKTFTGTWDNPIIVNTARIWHDTAASKMRVKYGSAPASISDGTTFG